VIIHCSDGLCYNKRLISEMNRSLSWSNMFRICKICGTAKLFSGASLGTRARGFHGLVCYGCYLEDQRAWRGTALGREEANEASRAHRRRKACIRNVLRDA